PARRHPVRVPAPAGREGPAVGGRAPAGGPLSADGAGRSQPLVAGATGAGHRAGGRCALYPGAGPGRRPGGHFRRKSATWRTIGWAARNPAAALGEGRRGASLSACGRRCRVAPFLEGGAVPSVLPAYI